MLMRILTPLRKGKQGAEALNAWIDATIQRLMPPVAESSPLVCWASHYGDAKWLSAESI